MSCRRSGVGLGASAGGLGSVLGPLFFILYVNDMVRVCPELALVLFADDTSIPAKGASPIELFQKVSAGLHLLSKWFKHNQLLFWSQM